MCLTARPQLWPRLSSVNRVLFELRNLKAFGCYYFYCSLSFLFAGKASFLILPLAVKHFSSQLLRRGSKTNRIPKKSCTQGSQRKNEVQNSAGVSSGFALYFSKAFFSRDTLFRASAEERGTTKLWAQNAKIPNQRQDTTEVTSNSGVK